jgi:hypothetical protein
MTPQGKPTLLNSRIVDYPEGVQKGASGRSLRSRRIYRRAPHCAEALSAIDTDEISVYQPYCAGSRSPVATAKENT